MADLTNILGGPWRPPQDKQPDPPEIQFADAMREAGIEPPDHIQLDGQIHRFRSGTKGKPGEDKAGWYVAFGDGVPAGRFGCWRADIEQTWRANIGRTLTPAEEMVITRRVAEAKAQRDVERAKKQEAVAGALDEIWIGGTAASPDHPYLKRKEIHPHGLRTTGDGRLMVPMHNLDGEICGMQYIDSEGGKKYHSGSAANGAFFHIGEPSRRTLIAEGFATAATLHEITGEQVYVAFSASNLPKVTTMLRERLGNQHELVIVADNDGHGVGKNYADQAAAKSGATVIMPPIEGMDANDYHQQGYDLAGLLSPQDTDWLVPADDWCQQPAPIAWMVKHWLQEQALIMVHGPSGGGKTFQVLDWCLRIASSTLEWRGNRVKPGAVVYLAGEGHHGLRGRIAAWKHYHQSGGANMWLSRSGCDLNTPEGYAQATNAIRALPEQPCLIVVDTLHRFLQGDENSAQDAKTMLDACAGLMGEFGCSALLVHHTGVSEEAQHRARGSSAWRGALDIEISVIPPKGDAEEIQIVQRKAKDSEQAEPLWCRLESVVIPGWLDEDGEPVTSAVMVEVDAPPEKDKGDSKLAQHQKAFESAWWAGGAEVREGKPYLSNSALIDWLVSNKGIKRESAKQYTKPSQENRIIGYLMAGDVISGHEHGWVVEDNIMASSMMVRMGEK